uniref:Uncharacterized protein n=1 Tax=Rhizophora mucronata TaxID=61149 RepID=A0A2P2PL00_RHIMU
MIIKLNLQEKNNGNPKNIFASLSQM